MTKPAPTHIAFIMDGNGRWAKQRNLPRIAGHKKGVDTVRRLIRHSKDLGIKYVSFYTFSTENWKRPEDEVSFLMDLIKLLAIKEVPELIKQGSKVNIVGNINGLPDKVRKSVKTLEEKTKNGTNITVNFMLNYGSRDEILNACKKLIEQKETNPALEINELTFNQNLYTHHSPDPDILIRTSNEHRISNFMLWQISYSELFFVKPLWPDFTKEDLDNIIEQYHERHRRYGGV